VAARTGQSAIATLILARGALVSLVNKKGENPYKLAISSRQDTVAELLKKHGGEE
jgi:ankyrin repeat protein